MPGGHVGLYEKFPLQTQSNLTNMLRACPPIAALWPAVVVIKAGGCSWGRGVRGSVP